MMNTMMVKMKNLRKKKKSDGITLASPTSVPSFGVPMPKGVGEEEEE